MDAALAWMVVIGSWGLLFFVISTFLESQGLAFISGLAVAFAVFGALIRMTIIFLQWAEAWPYIPQ